MPMSEDKQQRFNAQLDQAVDAAKAALAPVFNGAPMTCRRTRAATAV